MMKKNSLGGRKPAPGRRLDVAEALDECLDLVAQGISVEEAAARYPGLEAELGSLLGTTQLIDEAPLTYPQYRPLERREMERRIFRLPHQVWSSTLTFAAVCAIAALIAAIPSPTFGSYTALAGAAAWLTWWCTDFLPRLGKERLAAT